MPRTTWFTAFVRCNTKHIYKSKIRSKKKLNCDRETCNQSVEFHNGSGRTDCVPRQTTNFIKLEMAKNSFQTLQPAIFRVLKNKLPLYVLKQFSHILTKRLLIYYVNVIGKFSQTVFGDSLGKSLIDLFTASGFLSLRQKHRKIISGHPSCVAKTKSW